MKAYATLTDIKSASYLNLSTTAHDTWLRKLLEESSDLIDSEVRFSFQPVEETRYFDAAGKRLDLAFDPLLSLSTLKVDNNADDTFEDTYATGDYHLYPYNKFPKTAIRINANGDYGSFGTEGALKVVEIAGVWGYGNGLSATPYTSSGATTSEELDASETGVDVSSGAAFAVGNTIRIDSEQMYITGIASNTLTVRRGVNGTTAATHATAKTVYYYEYPPEIVQACLVQAMRTFKRKDTSYLDVMGNPETGTMTWVKQLDPDVALRLSHFRQILV